MYELLFIFFAYDYRFLRKQGLLRTFYECDYHLWRVGNRSVPTGIRVDGGSDWICLSREFTHYITSSQDELVQGLNQYFTYALLPAEVRLYGCHLLGLTQ